MAVHLIERDPAEIFKKFRQIVFLDQKWRQSFLRK